MAETKKKSGGKTQAIGSVRQKNSEAEAAEEYVKVIEVRSKELKKNLNTRLNRMEGQMKGVRQMVDNDRSYADLVIQGISLISALKSFCRIVMEEHLKTEVAGDLRQAKEESLQEFTEMMQKVMM